MQLRILRSTTVRRTSSIGVLFQIPTVQNPKNQLGSVSTAKSSLGCFELYKNLLEPFFLQVRLLRSVISSIQTPNLTFYIYAVFSRLDERNIMIESIMCFDKLRTVLGWFLVAKFWNCLLLGNCSCQPLYRRRQHQQLFRLDFDRVRSKVMEKGAFGSQG